MYGNYGYGGMGGGMGMPGQGQEMMIVVVCCICCLCVACILGGYMTNAFCSMGFGKSCTKKDDEGERDRKWRDEEPATLAPGTGTVASPNAACSEAYALAARTDPRDPRPAIRPDVPACAGQEKVGKDCYYWTVGQDPITGFARWMRKPADAYGDARYGGTCTPTVSCAARIDPTTLGGYNEIKPDDLLKQCSSAVTATTEADSVKYLTTKAAEVGANWTGSGAWTSSHSQTWFNNVKRYVAQKDLSVYINNTVAAATIVKSKLNQNTLYKKTFAYMLEAAVRAPDNTSDWIITAANQFNNAAISGRQANEDFFIVTYLKRPIRTLQSWERIIGNF